MVVNVGAILVFPQAVGIFDTEGQVSQDLPHQIGRGVDGTFKGVAVLPAQGL